LLPITSQNLNFWLTYQELAANQLAKNLAAHTCTTWSKLGLKISLLHKFQLFWSKTGIFFVDSNRFLIFLKKTKAEPF